MRRLQWSPVRTGGGTVWCGWAGGKHLATVERRGKSWGVTVHRTEGDEVRPERFTVVDGAKRLAEHLWG